MVSIIGEDLYHKKAIDYNLVGVLGGLLRLLYHANSTINNQPLAIGLNAHCESTESLQSCEQNLVKNSSDKRDQLEAIPVGLEKTYKNVK